MSAAGSPALFPKEMICDKFSRPDVDGLCQLGELSPGTRHFSGIRMFCDAPCRMDAEIFPAAVTAYSCAVSFE